MCVKYLKSILLLSCFILAFTNCKQKPVASDNAAFSLYLLQKDDSHAILLTQALDSTAALTQAIPVPSGLNFNREFILKDGFYYQLNPKNRHFRKFGLNANGLVPIDSIDLGDNYLENVSWVNNSDTLLIATIESTHLDKGNIFLLDTRNFKLILKKQLPLPAAKDDFNILSIGIMELKANKLWFGYSYSQFFGKDDYSTADSMYFMTIDLASGDILHQEEDHRSTYPGGFNLVQSYSFTDEKGDFYFMSCPGIAMGNNLQQPTGIFRKQKDSLQIDPKFFINISQQIQNHAYGLWYLGKQEAIIRAEQQDKYSDFSNHHSTYQFEYYRVNLLTGAFSKLDLPLDKGTRKENVWIKDGIAYIAIDDAQDQHAVWIYDSTSEKIKKGITVPNNSSYILRLDHLK